MEFDVRLRLPNPTPNEFFTTPNDPVTLLMQCDVHLQATALDALAQKLADSDKVRKSHNVPSPPPPPLVQSGAADRDLRVCLASHHPQELGAEHFLNPHSNQLTTLYC